MSLMSYTAFSSFCYWPTVSFLIPLSVYRAVLICFSIFFLSFFAVVLQSAQDSCIEGREVLVKLEILYVQIMYVVFWPQLHAQV